MVKVRAEKVQRVANFIPDVEVKGATEGDLLIVGWGGTNGSLLTAFNELQKSNSKVGYVHFNYINPLPKNTATVLANYKNILVCELNSGQFIKILQTEAPQFNYTQYNKVQGLPFNKTELLNAFNNILEEA